MRRKAWMGLAAGLLLAGCVAPTPIYNTTYYENVGEMNRAGRAVGVMAIEPTKTPIGGRLKVVIPTDRSITEQMIRGPEKEQLDKLEGPAKAATLAAAANFYNKNYGFFPDILRKLGLFQEVVVERADFGKDPDLGGFDYVHWFSNKDGSAENLWFKGKDGVKRGLGFKPDIQGNDEASHYKSMARSYAARVEEFMRANYAPTK